MISALVMSALVACAFLSLAYGIGWLAIYLNDVLPSWGPAALAITIFLFAMNWREFFR